MHEALKLRLNLVSSCRKSLTIWAEELSAFFFLWNKHTLEGIYMSRGKEIGETLVLLLGLEP